MKAGGMRLRLVLALLVCGLLASGCGGGGGPSAGDARTSAAPDVLLVTIDTLRADRLGRGVTPTLDGLAREGTTFTNARATAPLTLPSHATIMTGLLPPEHGARQNGAILGPGLPRLARLFRDRGYQTAAFVGAYVLDRRFGLEEGFDRYDDRIPRDPKGATRLEAERRADAVVSAALSWFDGADAARPVFVWVHLYDPHAPYEPPPDARRAAGGSAYDGEVAFADAQLGRLLHDIRTRRRHPLLVAAAGDHGEGLGEHGETTHGMLAYDSTLRVPLVLAGPDIPKGATNASPASLRDVAPTLLGAANVKAPGDMTGRDLLHDRAAAGVYAETTYPETAGWSAVRVVVDDRWKLIASSTRELYDVVKDPGERRDVAALHPGVVSAMDGRAVQIFARGGRSAGPASPEAAERLRALGYVSPSPAPARPGQRAPNPRDRIEEWNTFEAALSLLAAGRGADALPRLRALVSRDPDARVFMASLAQALQQSGDARGAVRVLRGVVARWPEDATSFHDLAVAAREAGDLSEAMRAEQAALALNGSDPNARNGLGLLHADAGRWREAAAAFEQAARLDPNNASFPANLGNARRSLGDLAGAEQAYRQALAIDEQHSDAANGMGVILVQQRRPAEALAWFQRAIASDPSSLEAQLNLGIALHESGQTQRAAEQYRKIIAATPGGSREKQAATQLLRDLR